MSSQSPIKPARTPRAKALDGINLSDVMKARKEQDRILRARLKRIDSDIKVLMIEYEMISDILGIKREDDRQEPDVALPEGFNPDDVAPRPTGHKCADCGSTLGPNARGDCQGCGAGPFEQAR